MAEIGLIASVLQIASCGLKLSITLYTFAETVSNADKNIKHIAKDVSLTSAVLNELGSSLENDKQRMVASENAIRTAKEVLSECSEIFNEIETTLQKGMKKASSGNRIEKLSFEMLKWPFLQPKMELLRSNLERLKSTLILMLNVFAYAHKVKRYGPCTQLRLLNHFWFLGSATSSKIECDFDRLQIGSLIAANKKAMENFELLKRAIENGDIPVSLDTEGQSIHGGQLDSDHHSNPQGTTGLADLGSNSGDNPSSPHGFSNDEFAQRFFNDKFGQGKPMFQITSDSIKAQGMSKLDPIALMARLRRQGLLVGGIEEGARSKITATRQRQKSDVVEHEGRTLIILEDISDSQPEFRRSRSKSPIRRLRLEVDRSKDSEHRKPELEHLRSSRSSEPRGPDDARLKGLSPVSEQRPPHQKTKEPGPDTMLEYHSHSSEDSEHSKPRRMRKHHRAPNYQLKSSIRQPRLENESLKLIDDIKSHETSTGREDHDAGPEPRLKLKMKFTMLDNEVDDLLKEWTTDQMTIESEAT